MMFTMDSAMRLHQTPKPRQRREWVALTQYHIILSLDQYSTDGGVTWNRCPSRWIGNTLYRVKRFWFGAPPSGTLLRTRWEEFWDRDEAFPS